MRSFKRIFGAVLATLALISSAIVSPATALADVAVSFDVGDIGEGDTVYLGMLDGTPIAWDVESVSEGTAAVHSDRILFTAPINAISDPRSVSNLTLEASDLYTSTLPNFKDTAFSDAEGAMTGAFVLSGNFGYATTLSGMHAWYWINEQPSIGGMNDNWQGKAIDYDPNDYHMSDVNNRWGVRPASSFNLNSALFVSAAEGGKDGAETGGFAALSDTSSVSAWKLTLLDSTREISASATGTAAEPGYTSWTVPVTFSGGGEGANDYVSAILCDGDGNAIYYGTVAAGAASGTQDMAMPAGLSEGSYTLKVFSEQRNGDKATDYAGPSVDIALSVVVEYTVTVVGGSADVDTAAAGTTVTITADDPETGRGFFQWTGDGVEFDAADSAQTTFAMPDADVTVTAVFKPLLTITVIDQAYLYDGDPHGEGDTAYEDPAQIAEKVTVVGLMDGDAITSLIIDGAETEVGVYEGVIEITGFTINGDPDRKDDYIVTLVPGTLTIAQGYTVTFADEDGTVLQSGKVAYGEVPAYTGEEPSKAATAQCTYEFAGWTPEVVAVTGDATYTATYTETLREYTVEFVDEDGTVLQTGKVAYGEVPAYTGEEPSKAADAQYSYGFAGWIPEVAAVTGDATYTATYSQTVNEYTVTFVDEDGTVLQSGKVAYGDTPAYSGDEPTKAADAENTYAFAGWSPELAAVTADTTYTATYKATPVPPEPRTATLTFDLAGGMLDGKTGTVTVTANVGDTITLPAAPTREGYTFTCWKGSEYAAGASYTVEGDHAFTAAWEEDAEPEPDPKPKPEPEPEPKPQPKPVVPDTGDASSAVPAILLAVGLAALAMSICVRRRRTSCSITALTRL